MSANLDLVIRLDSALEAGLLTFYIDVRKKIILELAPRNRIESL